MLLARTIIASLATAVGTLGSVGMDGRVADLEGETLMVAETGSADGEAVSGLPYAPPAQTFASLDEYVEYRARVAAMGGPTLREISTGLFVEEFQGGQVNHYSRAELLRALGFKR